MQRQRAKRNPAAAISCPRLLCPPLFHDRPPKMVTASAAVLAGTTIGFPSITANSIPSPVALFPPNQLLRHAIFDLHARCENWCGTPQSPARRRSLHYLQPAPIDLPGISRLPGRRLAAPQMPAAAPAFTASTKRRRKTGRRSAPFLLNLQRADQAFLKSSFSLIRADLPERSRR